MGVQGFLLLRHLNSGAVVKSVWGDVTAGLRVDDVSTRGEWEIQVVVNWAYKLRPLLVCR